MKLVITPATSTYKSSNHSRSERVGIRQSTDLYYLVSTFLYQYTPKRF